MAGRWADKLPAPGPGRGVFPDPARTGTSDAQRRGRPSVARRLIRIELIARRFFVRDRRRNPAIASINQVLLVSQGRVSLAR